MTGQVLSRYLFYLALVGHFLSVEEKWAPLVSLQLSNRVIKRAKKMLIKSESFGKKDKFKVGDLVWWNKIGKNMSGVVQDLFLKEIGGRKVAFATVLDFNDQTHKEILCINLKKMVYQTKTVEEN